MPNPLFLFLYIFFCMLIGFLGQQRLFGFWGYFFASIIFTPVGGLFLLIPSEPPKSQE